MVETDKFGINNVNQEDIRSNYNEEVREEACGWKKICNIKKQTKFHCGQRNLQFNEVELPQDRSFLCSYIYFSSKAKKKCL